MMWEEEKKGGHLPINVQPKVHTMKACIVSMKYTDTIKKDDGTPKLKELAESYDAGEKVKQLLENTLGWDTEDVSTF